MILMEVPGLAPVAFEYDAGGRLTAITEGAGFEARVSRIAYNDQGYIKSVTDPMNRMTAYEYDLAGRVTAQTGPDGRRIPFTYNNNGNTTSITPPGKPTHSLTYTPVNLEETYNPPVVTDGGTNETRYAYNLNRHHTQVTRPDGRTLGFQYDTMGRLSAITIPDGKMEYLYDPVSGNLTDIVTPGGEVISYDYDGSLRSTAAAIS